MALLTDPTADLIAFSGISAFPGMVSTDKTFALYPATYQLDFAAVNEDATTTGSQEIWTTS